MQNEDKTIIMPTQSQNNLAGQPIYPSQVSLQIIVKKFDLVYGTYFFQQSVRVGRATDNDLVLPFSMISRYHLEIKRGINAWYIHDLKSANGTLVNDEKISQPLSLMLPTSVQFGDADCFLELSLTVNKNQTQLNPNNSADDGNAGAPVSSSQSKLANNLSSSQTAHSVKKLELSKELMRKRLLNSAEVEDLGDYTRMARQIIHEDRAKRTKYYRGLSFSAGILIVICVGLLIYQQLTITRARQLAIDMFYDIKTMELTLAKAEIDLDENSESLKNKLDKLSQQDIQEKERKLAIIDQKVSGERAKINTMKNKYKQYLQEARGLDFKLPTAENYETDLIIKITGEFGESELEVNKDFVKEVKKYIGLWKKTVRLAKAIERLENNNYKPIIIQALDKKNISRKFIYLPLQESNFNTQAIGPETRYGIAKGAWQFLDETGKQFGLKTGDLANAPVYDANDERFDLVKSSTAGAKYLKYIYSTEAQASGLLVMAAYNYGHNRVKSLIRALPENPRERNFWKFSQKNPLPQETYDYVFYIFSAAVIGEDPKHFGFAFDPPLELKEGI